MNGISMVKRVRNFVRWRARACEVWVRSLWIRLLSEISRAPITAPGGPVVSLTTYGDRVDSVHLAIETIAHGQVKPSTLILWLDEKSAARKFPAVLRKQQRRGLEIRTCRDLGPHKKYYPYVESCGSITVPLVTADDDLLYPRWWLKGLVEAYANHPEVVNCYRARLIQFSGQDFASYREWELTTSTEPSFRHFAGSGAGTILSPALQRSIRDAGDAFLNCCPRADDIWLHVQAVRAGYKVRQIRSREFRLLEIGGTQEQALYFHNLTGGGNDRQIAATYTASDVETVRLDGGHEKIATLRPEELLSV